MDRSAALDRLRRAREAFYCAAAGYALLTSEEVGSAITGYTIRFGERDLRILPRSSANTGRGLSRNLQYNRAVDDPYASEMVETVYRQLIIESVEATRKYAKGIGEQQSLEKEHWFAFAAHLRNAFGHDGLWQFKGSRPIPVTWNNFTITKAMEGTPARGFLPWFWGTNLCAQMALYVGGNVDIAQRAIPKAAR